MFIQDATSELAASLFFSSNTAHSPNMHVRCVAVLDLNVVTCSPTHHHRYEIDPRPLAIPLELPLPPLVPLPFPPREAPPRLAGGFIGVGAACLVVGGGGSLTNEVSVVLLQHCRASVYCVSPAAYALIE